MFETVKNRRTIRKYLPKDINPSLLNDLLETSFRASTMGGMQLYSVIVTRDAEMKEKLSPAHFNQPMVKNAPVVLTFCADFRRFSKWCEQRKAVPGAPSRSFSISVLKGSAFTIPRNITGRRSIQVIIRSISTTLRFSCRLPSIWGWASA